MRDRITTGMLVSGIVSLVVGCAGPLPHLPQADVPTKWSGPVSPDAPLWPTKTWWNEFGSTELNGLIEAAQSGNLSLAAAAARVRQADARRRQAIAGLLPMLGLDASGTHQYGRSNGNSAHETDYAAGFTASYEADFWGKNRDALSAAGAAKNASRADREIVALTTVATVASTYFELLAARERLSTAREDLQSARDLTALIERRVHAGYSPSTDLAQQMASTTAEETLIPQLEQQEAELRGALAVLLGRPPEGFDVNSRDLAGIQFPIVSPGLPSELLARRPDVVAAEANLVAAHADLAAARAAFLPSVVLTGSGGLQSPALNGAVMTIPGTGLGLAAGATVVETVFGGGLFAKEAEARAKQQELLADYGRAVIAAFSDVENSLGGLAHTTQQQALEEKHVVLSERVFDGAQRRYRVGTVDFLAVADAQRSLYAARDQLSQARLARLQATIALYKALGGGLSVVAGTSK